jgi:hypothetical protein
MYARCSDNNTADTALSAFMEGVSRYGIPNRVRTDFGGENMMIGDYMLDQRGLGRRSILCGKSTHNQRIERQWRDMTKEVTSFYKQIFIRLEERHRINFCDEDAIYCLHYLFLTRINQDLQRYIRVWNNHKLSTEHNRSPNELLLVNQHVSAALVVNEDDFGVEEYYQRIDNSTYEDFHSSQVEVTPLQCSLTAPQYQAFSTSCRPLTLNDQITDDPFAFDDRYLQTLATYHMIVDG